MVKKKLLLIALFFCLVAEMNSQELLPFVENFTKSEYNGDNQVWNAVQGSDNAMYFANNHYFLRYNGVRWEKYMLPNKTIIRSVFSDGDRIYSGSYNELGYWKRVSGTMMYFSLSKKKNLFKGTAVNEEIWKIFKFKGKLYFQSFNEIYIYDGKNIAKLNVPSQLSYCFPIKDSIYVATVNNGIYMLKGKTFSKKKEWSILDNEIIHSIDSNNGKTYIFTKKNGVFIADGSTIKPWGNSLLNNQLKKELINTAKFINKGKLAIGTAFKGIYIVDITNNTFININRNNSLKNNSVLSIGFDSENDLWLGMDNGISHVEINSPYTIFSDNTGVLGSVYSVLNTDTGFLMGTNHGVFNYQDKQLSFVQGSQGQVWQIDKVNERYIIGHNDGTFAYSNNKLQKLNTINGGWQILKNNYGKGYFQAYYSGIVIYDDATFTTYKKIKGLTKPIKKIAQNRRNELWAVDSYRGLYRIIFNDNQEVKAIENITQSNGIRNDYNVKMFNYKNEILFFINNKWYKFNTITNKLEIAVLFNDIFKVVSDVVPIDDESFLILKNGLFYVIHQEDAVFVWDLIPKKYYEGKILNEDTEVIKHNDRLIINIDDGFFTYSYKKKNTNPQNITIEGYYKSNLIDSDTKINYNHSIQLNVISPTYGYNKLNLYYKLNNSSYIPITNGNVILNNLSSGNQEFSVFSQKEGRFVEIANYDFKVARPWYFSFWMVLLYVLLISGTFFLYYRWNKIRYIEKIKLKEEELKHQKQIIELELIAENKLKMQEYDKHILEIQIQTKASEVAGKSLSIAKQSEMIDNIQNILSSENNVQSLKSQINKVIKINSLNKNEWKEFEINLFKSNEEFIKALTAKYNNLTPKDIRLCIYLKMNLSSKEIAQLMNISYRGVELHRYRLRKKISIPQDENLSKFLMSISN